MIEVGRLCIKLAGRDAKQYCVVTEILDDTYVMIDGQTRNKKCNIKHLEPLDKVLKLPKKASHADVQDALKQMHIVVRDSKKKEKKAAKPVKKRKAASKTKPAKKK